MTSTATSEQRHARHAGARAAPTGCRRRWRSPSPARNSPMPERRRHRQARAHRQPGAAALGRLLARRQRHARRARARSRATTSARGRSPGRDAHRHRDGRAERGDRRHHGHRARPPARGRARPGPPRRRRPRRPRPARAPTARAGSPPLHHHGDREQDQRHALRDHQHGEQIELARLQPADEVGEPPGDAGGQPERYCDHFTLQPTGSVSAGSGAEPSSTASSAPRSHSAPADGSS